MNPSTRRNKEVDLPNSIFLFAYPFGSGCNFCEERIVTYGGCVALRYTVTGYLNVR